MFYLCGDVEASLNESRLAGSVGYMPPMPRSHIREEWQSTQRSHRRSASIPTLVESNERTSQEMASRSESMEAYCPIPMMYQAHHRLRRNRKGVNERVHLVRLPHIPKQILNPQNPLKDKRDSAAVHRLPKPGSYDAERLSPDRPSIDRETR